MQDVALEIQATCEHYGSCLVPVWIPREQNKRADDLSRITDSDDWAISYHVFDILDRKWGPHTVDRFASDYNSKCIRFNSRWGCPTSEGVDAFKQTWENEVNWWVPPPRLAARVIDKAIKEQARGTLIVPKWKSAPFWPKIFQTGQFITVVKDSFDFSPNEIMKGRGNNGIFGSKNQSFAVVALKLRC